MASVGALCEKQPRRACCTVVDCGLAGGAGGVAGLTNAVDGHLTRGAQVEAGCIGLQLITGQTGSTLSGVGASGAGDRAGHAE